MTGVSQSVPICPRIRPARAEQRLPTAAKADAEAKAKTDAVAEERAEANAEVDADAEAEEASAGRGEIPGPTGNSAKSRGPATGAFDLRRGSKRSSALAVKKHSGVAAIRPPAGTVKSPPPGIGHDVGAH